ncbi:MAG: response regulator, partial [Verrucomicrobiota bacterium]
MKLLIVDDSLIIRRMIERKLDTSMFESIDTATNGKDAVEKFTANPAEVVTMDITMPEMDGLACIEKLLTVKDDVRILVISALADRSTAVEAVKQG